MCGINGIIAKHAIDNPKNRINRMNESIKHRGPDAEGSIILFDSHIALGQRRLSIIDLDARSNQPFLGNDDTSVLVYNGEIYNYQDLKIELEYDYRTNSDTEVLFAGIQKNGIEWIKKTNGMFAFCFFDKEMKKIYLCRDRMGIKPLYYYMNNEYFIFSSEIKAILNSGLVKAELNENAIDEYLANRYVREPYTFFKNIYQVKAGHYLELDNNFVIKDYCYWTLPEQFNFQEDYNETEIYEGFKNEVISSIKRRLISDVELGTYLSGGIDSSLISAITSLNSVHKINTYTIGFPELNEFEYAELVAKEYGTVHHTIYTDSKDYFELMPEIIAYKDAPLGVPNEVLLAVMSRILKENITVVLSGEGADELMGGYGRIFRSPFDFENIDKSHSEDFYTYFINKYEYVPRLIRDKYLNVGKSLREEFDNQIRQEYMGLDNREILFRFFHSYHIKGLLQRLDTTTMCASVEARVPFLDHQLIEYTYRNVPYDLKLRWKNERSRELAKETSSSMYSEKYDLPKYLLRKMGHEFLPEKVVSREKIGFPVPLDKWYDQLTEMSRKYLIHCNWLKRSNIEELIKECQNNTRSGQLLWMFINVEMFRRMYFDKEWRY